MNVDFADDAYFYTEFRYQQLLKAREEGVVQLDHTTDEAVLLDEDAPVTDAARDDKSGIWSVEDKKKNLGTVGAVACDFNGNLAAATSTGGMTNKKFGRVGDTPIIGSGTYADNSTCAVSCTGHGEFFMSA